MEIENKQINGLESRFNQINQQIMKMDLSDLSLGLFHGKMGVCIYYFIS